MVSVLAWMLLGGSALAQRVEPPGNALIPDTAGAETNSSISSAWDAIADEVVFVVKTGGEVINQRMPNLHNTWLKHAKHHMVVSDHDGEGVINVIDTSKLKSGEKGWNSDRLKNIPAFKQAIDKFPGKTWYMMVDDDTYVSLKHLTSLLSRHNPKDKTYVGNNYIISGEGCDGLTINDNRLFAHGGSGIVLSRSAVEAVSGNAQQCMDKFGACWAGDGMLGICLHSLGVDPDKGLGLCGDSPWDFKSKDAPGHCSSEEQVSYHHLKQRSEFDALYKLDKESDGLRWSGVKKLIHAGSDKNTEPTLQHLLEKDPRADTLRVVVHSLRDMRTGVVEGYHDLDTLMQKAKQADVVVLQNAPDAVVDTLQAWMNREPKQHHMLHERGLAVISTLPLRSLHGPAEFHAGAGFGVEVGLESPIVLINAAISGSAANAGLQLDSVCSIASQHPHQTVVVAGPGLRSGPGVGGCGFVSIGDDKPDTDVFMRSAGEGWELADVERAAVSDEERATYREVQLVDALGLHNSRQ